MASMRPSLRTDLAESITQNHRRPIWLRPIPELAKWQQLDADSARRSTANGCPAMRKKNCLKRSRKPTEEGTRPRRRRSIFKGITSSKRRDDYRNNFEVNYLLGYFYLVKGAVGLQRAREHRVSGKGREIAGGGHQAQSHDARWSNLAICYSFRGATPTRCRRRTRRPKSKITKRP